MTSLKNEIYIYVSEYKRFKSEALENIDQLKASADEKVRIKKDYTKSLIRYRVTFNEYYFQYMFQNLSAKERKKFISRSEMQKIYRKFGNSDVRDIFMNKKKFLETFNSYIKRKWIMWNRNSAIDELEEIMRNNDCIIKPVSGSLGIGVKKICKNMISDYHEFVNSQLSAGDYLIEECVEACPEIAEFHPASLNTIRVVTFSNGGKADVFGAFLRLGNNNSNVDNAHAGGIFAQIDVDTGLIVSDGIDTDNNRYEFHPITKKKIKGFQIPKWDEIKNMCLSATNVIPNIHFAGWDVAIRKDGDLEFIEGNHAPDFDVMQSPLNIGVRQKVFSWLDKFNIR